MKTTIVIKGPDGSMIGQVDRSVQPGKRYRCTIGGERYIVHDPHDAPHIYLAGPLPRDLVRYE